MFNNGHNFSDNRPMGLNNPTRLVEHYFPQSSFDVVYQVYNNLANIQAITNNLRTFVNIAHSAQDIARVKEYLTEIQTVADKLDNLVQLSDNIDFLKSIEPDLNKVVSDIKEIKTDYDAFNSKVYSLEEDIRKTSLQVMHSLDVHFKNASEAFCKLVAEKEASLNALATKVHNDLDEIADSIVESYNMKKELETYRCYILHTNAYVAVQDYKYFPDSSTKARALETIAMSEAIGNDETVNRLRMNEA